MFMFFLKNQWKIQILELQLTVGHETKVVKGGTYIYTLIQPILKAFSNPSKYAHCEGFM